MNNINSEVYVDISIIIGMMPIEMKNKISNSFINFIEKNKSNNYISSINPKVPLNEQKIRKETKEMLGIIYRDYLCEKREREELLKKEEQELYYIEQEMREKYNLDDIFKKKNGIQEEIKPNEETRMIAVSGEKWYKKIFNFIKNLFKRK